MQILMGVFYSVMTKKKSLLNFRNQSDYSKIVEINFEII